MKTVKYIYLCLLSVVFFTACDEHGDPQGKVDLNEKQTASVSMRGKWGQASDASLPFGTTPGVLDNLIIEFRIDDDYNPSMFSAAGAPYFFLGEDGQWEWSDETLTAISLSNILPVTSIDVTEEGHAIRLSFTYDGPEGGKVGQYGITLRKIAP